MRVRLDTLLMIITILVEIGFIDLVSNVMVLELYHIVEFVRFLRVGSRIWNYTLYLYPLHLGIISGCT